MKFLEGVTFGETDETDALEGFCNFVNFGKL